MMISMQLETTLRCSYCSSCSSKKQCYYYTEETNKKYQCFQSFFSIALILLLYIYSLRHTLSLLSNSKAKGEKRERRVFW